MNFQNGTKKRPYCRPIAEKDEDIGQYRDFVLNAVASAGEIPGPRIHQPGNSDAWRVTMTFFPELGEYLLSFLDRWLFWIGTVMLIGDLLEKKVSWLPRRLEKWTPAWLFASLAVLCFLLASFQVWQEEHEKVVSQRAYMEVKLDESWIQHSPGPWKTNTYPIVNFGLENSGSQAAEWVTTIDELVIKPAPRALDTYGTPDATPSTPSLEMEAWDEMLTDRRDAPRDYVTYDPHEHHWGSARTHAALSEAELDRIVNKTTSMVYLVGFVQWEDGDGIHGKSFCYWLHSPRSGIVTEQCHTHNGIVENPEKLLAPPRKTM